MASVLVVDDDPTLLRIVETVLRSAGLAVAARSAGDALRAASEHPPDCAVLDAAPHRTSAGTDTAGTDTTGTDMTGTELCRALRAGPRTADLPILLLTDRGDWLGAAEAFDAGADDYLPKPFSAQDLLTRVEALTLSRSTPRET